MAILSIPSFDVRLWCNACNKVIGTVNNVPDNDPRDFVTSAMRDHLLTEHADLMRA